MVRLGAWGGAFAFIGGYFLLAVVGGLAACDDSSSGPGGPTPNAGGFDAGGGGSSSGDPSNPTPGGPDAAPDGNTAFPTEPGIGLANLTGAVLDFCYMPPGATDWIGPVFRPEGGIPDRAVSVVRSVPIDSKVALISGAAGCDTPMFTPATDPNSATPRMMYVVRSGPSADGRRMFFRPADHVAGKEMVYFGPFGRDATFHPAGGGAPVEIDRDEVTPLDPNMTGEIRLTGGTDPVQTRTLKTGSGVLFLVENPNELIVCDVLAPQGHLLSCGSNVRVP
jgi:hypothetical protein